MIDKADIEDRSAARRHAERRGRRAEALAELALRLKGYRVLARRFRTPAGEIDLVVRRLRTVAFVEVKLRARDGTAAEAINARSQARIVRAAEAWLARHPQAPGSNLRFDAVLMERGRWPRHLPDAFRPSWP